MGPTTGRIRGRRIFRALARPDGRGRSGPVSVAFVASPVSGPGPAVRVGYAISRRHGNAVQRNRLRRRLREAARAVVRGAPAELVPGNYLVAADPPAQALPQPALEEHLAAAMASAARPRRTSPRATAGARVGGAR